MRYYIKLHRELDEPYGVNDNFTSKSYYLCEVIDAPTIPRNIPRKKKREKVEYMMENYNLKLTDNDVEVEDEEHVFVMPNPLVAEDTRRLQKSVYKGEVDIPEKIKKVKGVDE